MSMTDDDLQNIKALLEEKWRLDHRTGKRPRAAVAKIEGEIAEIARTEHFYVSEREGVKEVLRVGDAPVLTVVPTNKEDKQEGA